MLPRRWARRWVWLLGAWLACAPAAAAGDSGALHAEGVLSALDTTPRYAALQPLARPGIVLLRDDRRGQTTRVTVPCRPRSLGRPALGGHTLMVGCGSRAAVYDIERRRWRVVEIPRTPGCRSAGGSCDVSAALVGDQWVQGNEEYDCMEHGCAEDRVYVRIATGRPADPALTAPVRVGGHVTIDLNAPGLTRTLCAPLTEPNGPLTAAGRYVLAENVSADSSTSRISVERCGIGVLRTYRGWFRANDRVLLTCCARGSLSGVRIGDGRHVQLRLPRALRRVHVELAGLTDRRIYLQEASGRTWSLPAP